MSEPRSDEQAWATLTDGALTDEIRSNRRAERTLLVVVALIAAACTIVVLILHGPISTEGADVNPSPAAHPAVASR
jgi:hypothetical protein